MWHLTRVPRIAHFYWGGSPLSFLRYLTLASFRRHNPDWHMILHQPKHPSLAAPAWQSSEQSDRYQGPDHTDRVTELDVEIRCHVFQDLGFDDQAHEVHKSDFLRWQVLSHQGGLWSDMDIIYLRSMLMLRENHAQYQDLDVGLVPLQTNKKHTVGFLLSSANNSFMRFMLKESVARYAANQYQCMGTNILNSLGDRDSIQAQNPGCRIEFLEKKCVYRINSKRIPVFYQPLSETQEPLHQRHILGFHWYGGHALSNSFERGITETNWHQGDTTLTAIMTKAMT